MVESFQSEVLPDCIAATYNPGMVRSLVVQKSVLNSDLDIERDGGYLNNGQILTSLGSPRVKGISTGKYSYSSS